MQEHFIFDVEAFRVQFPAFSNATLFPDPMLQMYWDQATCIIKNNNYGRLRGRCKFLALNLLTAHLTQIYSDTPGSGDTPGTVTSASIDKVSVTVAAPPQSTEFVWWLNTTKYGMQLAAMLKARSVGGFYIPGGLSERSSIRKSFGVF